MRTTSAQDILTIPSIVSTFDALYIFSVVGRRFEVQTLTILGLEGKDAHKARRQGFPRDFSLVLKRSINVLRLSHRTPTSRVASARLSASACRFSSTRRRLSTKRFRRCARPRCPETTAASRGVCLTAERSGRCAFAPPLMIRAIAACNQ